jgi:hypothetical protein
MSIKFYDSHFEEYVSSIEKYNLHPELTSVFSQFPKHISKLSNMIIFGPSGIGKYSQMLLLLKKYSPAELKYEKKITIQLEKTNYIYHISDIHYEIDMSLLGCNYKILWSELFSQIFEIISVKQEKVGIIVCKNFHTIHPELLEIFYSYMQQYSHPYSKIQIKFILLTEHISFITNNILNNCYILSLQRPSSESYNKLLQYFAQSTATTHINENIVDMIKPENILNIKEIRALQFNELNNMPKDIFNIVCNNIIKDMTNHSKIVMTAFRDTIYDILIYNLDIGDVLWYILTYFVKQNNVNKHIRIEPEIISDITNQCYTFLKYYNNNYRPIYHLESIFFYFITKIYNYES